MLMLLRPKRCREHPGRGPLKVTVDDTSIFWYRLYKPISIIECDVKPARKKNYKQYSARFLRQKTKKKTNITFFLYRNTPNN